MSKDRVEHKIGDVVELNCDGAMIKFKVCESLTPYDCSDCALEGYPHACNKVHCGDEHRSDNKDVDYKEVKEDDD